MGVDIVIHDNSEGISFETNWKNREESCNIQNFSEAGFKWFMYEANLNLDLHGLNGTDTICPSSIEAGCCRLITSIFNKLSDEFEECDLNIYDFNIYNDVTSILDFFNTPSKYLSKIVLQMVSQIQELSDGDFDAQMNVFNKYLKKIKKIKSIVSYAETEYYTRFLKFVLFLEWLSNHGHSISWSY